MPLKVPTHKHAFDRLVAVMASLRAKEGGCPWDKVQTHQSLRPYLIEEAYEVLEAINANEPQKLKGELGDLLLQVVFHAQIAADKGQFTSHDVANAIADKMISRHPHVFGSGAKVKSAEDQVQKWEAIKSKEAEHKLRKSIVDGVPIAMPALYRARRVLSKASRASFTWRKKEQAWAKFEEELKEFRQAVKASKKPHKYEELGDLLVALTNVARFEKLDPEAALHAGVRKLSRRIQGVEERAAAKGQKITQLKESEILALWGDVKRAEKAAPKKKAVKRR
jgi:tetrapyrrole methylase family protein/MazG family protein